MPMQMARLAVENASLEHPGPYFKIDGWALSLLADRSAGGVVQQPKGGWAGAAVRKIKSRSKDFRTAGSGNLFS